MKENMKNEANRRHGGLHNLVLETLLLGVHLLHALRKLNVIPNVGFSEEHVCLRTSKCLKEKWSYRYSRKTVFDTGPDGSVTSMR